VKYAMLLALKFHEVFSFTSTSSSWSVDCGAAGEVEPGGSGKPRIVSLTVSLSNQRKPPVMRKLSVK
jgi:hypothetical protein